MTQVTNPATITVYDKGNLASMDVNLDYFFTLDPACGGDDPLDKSGASCDASAASCVSGPNTMDGLGTLIEYFTLNGCPYSSTFKVECTDKYGGPLDSTDVTLVYHDCNKIVYAIPRTDTPLV